MKFFRNYSPKKNVKILIVDDQISMAHMVSETLENYGFNTLICNRSEDTFKYLEEHKIDLILLDLVMPGLSGVEVAKKIREELNKFIPIIIVSAMSNEKDKVIGLRYADDYVTKPFSTDEMIARINVQLRIAQLQNELLASKTRYQCLYENIPEMVISLDIQKKISDCNTIFCNYIGGERNSIIGKPFLSYFCKDEHILLTSFLNELKPEKISDNQRVFRLINHCKGEKPIYINIQAVRIGEKEAGLDIIAAMKDISISVNLQKQQKLARLQLYRSARLASIGILASGIAHEMNNPLTAILGFSDSLLHRFNKGERIDENEIIENLNIIKKESLRCRDVVENLSKFSQDFESQREKISLFDCLHSAVKLINVRANKKNIKIVNNIRNDIIVNTDVQKIGQVIVNILSNSIDFSENGGTITISVEKSKGKDPLKLVISDTGKGIPNDIIPKIFDPFFTTKEVGKGVGLGMSISYKLMEECHGSIEVKSKENIGTSVILEIPVE
jgi:PAS domain S-box-containing protein